MWNHDLFKLTYLCFYTSTDLTKWHIYIFRSPKGRLGYSQDTAIQAHMIIFTNGSSGQYMLPEDDDDDDTISFQPLRVRINKKICYETALYLSHEILKVYNYKSNGTLTHTELIINGSKMTYVKPFKKENKRCYLYI